jgi:membrane protein
MHARIKPFFSSFWKLVRLTYAAWRKDRAARLGASLAFYSVLSLGPLLLLVLVAAASIWGRRAAQGQIVDQMTGMIGMQGAQLIQGILKTSSESRHGGLIASLLSFATLLFSASGVFGELQDAMNTIWKVAPRTGKPVLVILRERFLSFTMVIGSAFLLLTSLVVSAAMTALARYADRLMPSLDLVMPAVDFVTSLGIITVLFAFTFKMVPDTRVAWRCVWPGALLTAVLFIVGKMLIGLYLAHTGVASSYGAAGSVIIILLWVYYSAQILFFGAEFSHAYAEHHGYCKKKG